MGINKGVLKLKIQQKHHLPLNWIMTAIQYTQLSR